MTTNENSMQSTAHKVGWWTLFIIGLLMALNHLSLMFILADEFVLFAGWAAFNLYALVVLYVPFRRGEKWAWNTSWLLPIFTASPAMPGLGDSEFGPYYLGAALLCVVALIITKSAFD